MPKTAIVTGATNGLGLATARGLAARGYRVGVLGRNPARIASALAEIGPNGTGFLADFARLDDVRRVAGEIATAFPAIDVLVNNAGLINTKRRLTVDGYEETFAVNHLAHFLLTGLLLTPLMAAPRPHVINVSSDAHKPFALQLDDLMAERRYTAFGAYGRSKSANLHFTFELARRAEGTRLRANALHPGGVASGFSQNNGPLARLAMALVKPFFLSPERAAETPIYMAVDPALDRVNGRYFAHKKELSPNAPARNPQTALVLWQKSEELTGFTWPAIPA